MAITGLSWLTAWTLCVRAESFDESELSAPTFCRAPLAAESSPIPDRDYESGVIPLAGHRLPPTELSDVLRRLEALESASLLPHAMHPIAEKENDKKPAEGQSASGDGKKMFDDGWIDVSDEKWTVKLGGHVQTDYINWAQADDSIVGAQDYFEFRRLRLVADGTGYGVCDFRLQMTLEPETVGETAPGTVTSPDVKDAYFSMNEIPWLGRVRIGNFFVPFSLEQVTNDTNNIFMERSVPTQGIFAADREVGVAFYNATDSQRIGWAYGAFIDGISDSIKERIDDNQGYRLSSRLTWLP